MLCFINISQYYFYRLYRALRVEGKNFAQSVDVNAKIFSERKKKNGVEEAGELQRPPSPSVLSFVNSPVAPPLHAQCKQRSHSAQTLGGGRCHSTARFAVLAAPILKTKRRRLLSCPTREE